ncbi:MAG: lipoate--protein ligase [Eubacteriaceae bacterium]|nr:lipoate--protein ligase [Eubacteriaceae bacterium]
MKYIKTNWAVPYYNMALEDYLTGDEAMGEDYLFFYINDPSVIIGSHQNTYAQVNEKFIRERGIYVARRLSGGGAVYHDRGNLNFSFVVNNEGGQKIDFARYTSPVLATLKDFGVKASLSGRNDLCIGERKFSGNAQYINKRKVLHHGTLMFDVNIEDMVSALNVSEMKIISKAVESVRSRVINLKSLMPEGVTIEDFKNALIEKFFSNSDFGEYTLSGEDISQVERRVAEKFSRREYNYGEKPNFSAEKTRKYPAGIFEAFFDVSKGKLTAFSLKGDFFTNRDIDFIEQGLIGVGFDEASLRQALEKIGFEGAIAGFGTDDFVDLLFC